MAENIEKDYSIRYRIIKLEKNKYILFPVKLQKGELFGYDFITDEETVPILDRPNSLKGKYVMGAVYTLDELRMIYDDEESDIDEEFLGDFFYTDKKNEIVYVETDDNNEIKSTLQIDLEFMQEKEESGVYMFNKDIPAIILNEDLLDRLLQSNDLREIKILLEKYRKLIKSFSMLSAAKGLTKVKMVNGKIDEIEINREIQSGIFPKGSYNTEEDRSAPKEDHAVESDFSYQGLREYIKQYVFGQDESIDTIAQKLYMNHTAIPGETVESILLVGPTGTGKTETIEAASRYLSIPYVPFNASNLNAQGIKGTSIEDLLMSLYQLSNEDIEKAQRGIIFLDEFDKLNDSDLETKTVIKNILLTFNGGGKFPVNNDNYNFVFDTLMTNKVYAGVFARIASGKKTIGFGNNSSISEQLSESDIRRKIIDNGYFTLEELSRISTVLPFNELDKETKIRILKESKLSTLAQKRSRYKRQFGIDIEITDDFIDAILEKLSNSETGMRSLNNLLKRIMDSAEKEIILKPQAKHKKLVLTRDTVDNSKKFDLS